MGNQITVQETLTQYGLKLYDWLQHEISVNTAEFAVKDVLSANDAENLNVA